MKYKGKTMTRHRVNQLKKNKERMDEWQYHNIILPNKIIEMIERRENNRANGNAQCQ